MTKPHLRDLVLTGGCALLLVAGVRVAAPAGAQVQPAGGATEAAAPELVENGNFESPRSPRAGLVGNFPTIPGWAETTGHGLEIQNGLARRAEGGGDQYVELDSRGPSSIYQDVATVPGRTYRLTFVYAAHPGQPASESAFDVTFGDTTQAIAPRARDVAAWRHVQMDVVAAADRTRLTFADEGVLEPAGAAGPGRVRGLGVFLDLVSVRQLD